MSLKQHHFLIKTDNINQENQNFNLTKQNLTEVNNDYYKINPHSQIQENTSNNQQIPLKNKVPLKKPINQDQTQNNNYIDISEYIGKESNRPLTIDILDMKIKNFENGKTSNKNMGIIKAYAANTHEGLIRNYNEDRVSIIINMNKPKNYNIEIKGKWPKVSFFAIYDGHGGKNCAEYLRDNLHKFICNDINFPNNIPEAIKNGFLQAENDFLNNYALNSYNNNVNDRSGSCAVIILIVNNKVYIGNVGDSRCIMSTNNGKNLREITIDHKPNEKNEKNRIIKNGGKVYQSQTPINNINNNNNNNNQILIGPYRVFPGRLSVSRTIGDIEAKNIKFGGNPNVIIPNPEIYIFDLINDDIDYFILGCDGIFDQINNLDIFNSVWMIINHFFKNGLNVHNICGKVVDFVLKCAMARKSFDNVTCLIVAFKDFGKLNFNENHEKKNENCGLGNINNFDVKNWSDFEKKEEKNVVNFNSDNNFNDTNNKNKNENVESLNSKNNINKDIKDSKNNDKEIQIVNLPIKQNINSNISNQDNNYQQSRYTQRENNNAFQLNKFQILKTNKLPINNINNTNKNEINLNNININNYNDKHSQKVINKRYNSSSKNKMNNFYKSFYENNNNYLNKFSIVTERLPYQYSISKYNNNNQKTILNQEQNNINNFNNFIISSKNSKTKRNYNINHNYGGGFRKRKELLLDSNENNNFYIRNNLTHKFNTTKENNGFLSYTVGRSYNQFKSIRNDLWK